MNSRAKLEDALERAAFQAERANTWQERCAVAEVRAEKAEAERENELQRVERQVSMVLAYKSQAEDAIRRAEEAEARANELAHADDCPDCKTLRRRVRELTEALEFYADKANYHDGVPGEWVTYPGHPGSYDGFSETEFEGDYGELASAALASSPEASGDEEDDVRASEPREWIPRVGDKLRRKGTTEPVYNVERVAGDLPTSNVTLGAQSIGIAVQLWQVQAEWEPEPASPSPATEGGEEQPFGPHDWRDMEDAGNSHSQWVCVNCGESTVTPRSTTKPGGNCHATASSPVLEGGKG